MPGIFDDKENGNLIEHLVKWRERNGGGKAKVLRQWVEEPWNGQQELGMILGEEQTRSEEVQR